MINHGLITYKLQRCWSGGGEKTLLKNMSSSMGSGHGKDDPIPYMKWENNPNVWNHQPEKIWGWVKTY